MVVLAPFLTWIHGPSVSTDQFVVRIAVFGLALTGAICLRVVKMAGIGGRKTVTVSRAHGDSEESNQVDSWACKKSCVS
jgi:hypothetical protein